jgi:carbon starvation protein
MNIALVMIASLAILVLAFRFYGRFISRTLRVDPSIPTPAVRINDGVDYVPTRPIILFAHHFAAIAAAGPIVGPTLALMFGFVPAWLWIMVGVVFVGAVHDFTALFVAMREGGKSIGEVARRTLGKPGFVFYCLFAIVLCLLVIAAFLQLTSVALTSSVPPDDVNLTAATGALHMLEQGGKTTVQIGGVASASVIIMTLIAPLVGWMIYRRRMNTIAVSVFAFVVSMLSIVAGFYVPVTIDPNLWIIIITVYVFFASWVPVWIILQPRDFTNAQILYLGIASMVVGVIGAGIAGARIDIPAWNLQEAMQYQNLGLVWPFLFITIACGAASGAHGLVCGGTSCKQISSERDAKVIGYGGMLLEGLLALCVILIIAGGLGFARYRELVYPIAGASNAPLAFALGLGKVLRTAVGLPTVYGTIWGILLLEGFLVTTIDALVRLTRYLFEELWATLFATPPAWLRSRITNSVFVIAGFLSLTFTNAYIRIWPIFGAANQLLAALTLIAVTAWLVQKSRSAWFTAVPAAFMVITTVAALVFLLKRYIETGNVPLTITNIVLLILAGGVVVLTFRYFYGLRKKMAATA